VDTDAQIDLESQHRNVIASDAFRTVAEQIGEIGRQQAGIAEEIEAGKVSEAVLRIAEFVTAWQLAQQVLVQNCRLTQQSLLEREYDGQPIIEHLKTLLERLTDIREALEAQDMVMLADIVHYETPGLCEAWAGMLNHLADQLSEAVAADSAEQ
ncbi:MAG: hypothetical protein JXO22_14900, partial [Phycisphaerae bacterium]|nr:hypothetical protein [Phycisphaerae bacterium]